MYKLIIAIVLASVYSCSSTRQDTPPVDVDRLSDLLTDLHLMEGLTNEMAVIIRDSMKQVYAENILADHEYSQTEFDSLIWIVRTEPEWIDMLFQKVSDKIATKEAEMSRTPPKLEKPSN